LEAGSLVEEPKEKKTNNAVWIAIMASFMGSGVAIFSALSSNRKKCKSDNE
jgi:hypothetical protein